MSYDLYLINRKTKERVCIRLGGLQQYGGTVSWNPDTRCINDLSEVHFNITYNYGCVFRLPEVLGLEGIRSLYGQSFEMILDRLCRARESVVRMFEGKMGIDQLSGEIIVQDDYWKATPGNVIKTFDHMILVLNVVRTQEQDCSDLTLEGD